MAALLEADIVIIGHAIIAVHLKTLGQQKLAEMIADEARGTRD